MSNSYIGSGIRFQYPDDWFLGEERGDTTDLTITVSDGQTTQWSITLMPDRPDPHQVLHEAINAFEEEYDGLDVTESEIVLAKHPALAADLDFECLELLNSAFLRVIATPRFTALILYQATGHELKEVEPLFDAINKSLDCDEVGDDQ
jgi:hypothetical protein